MTVDEDGNSSLWTREQDKAFENALATHPEDSLDLWERIAAEVPGKTPEEIKHHYELLVDDVHSIESGCIPLPPYNSPAPDGLSSPEGGEVSTGKKGGSSSGSLNGCESVPANGGKPSRSEQERRKGIAWTEEEHRLFLLGLDKYGKGDWRSISRNFVVTRTPTQVASHAQKYFIRLNSVNKDRRRSSIHDITSVETGEISASQGPITGQGSSPSAVVSAPGKSSKQQQQPSQPRAASAGLGTYGGAAMGQSMAIGTPVNHPAPMGYISSMGFPMPPASAQSSAIL
ncbi:hypothetical protein SAY86_023359 [Trapa natans]|uniref:Uncharacterized protein n=1 Tax=Trapa natans TaxID=22666 RepID=A0AAN7LVN0_TRANT|nr:hypothetical protein SAY86_023359 [Trapa natans]